ncbi:MAG TPA: DUF1592 domain-containing protein [Phycisphaerae bacterium]|nr:DUF1592 domain-containing protein [Phycisphaerae bacterium]
MGIRIRRAGILLSAYAGVITAAAIPFVWAAAPDAGGPKTEAALQADALADYHQRVEPVLEKYCFACHGDGMARGGFSMDKSDTLEEILAQKKHWEAALGYINKKQMPPADVDDQPTKAERAVITGWIERNVYHMDAAHPDPGRVTIRRLNRTEYSNSIRDLVGVDFDPAADFPADDAGYGFDNIGDVLTMPPMLLEKYLSAADAVVNAALPTAPPKSVVRHFAAAQAEVGFNAIGDRGDGWVQLISLEEDDVAVELPLPAGDYLFRVTAFAKRTGGALVGFGSQEHDPAATREAPVPPKLGFFVGSTFIKDAEVSTDEGHPGTYEVRVGLPAGKSRLRVVARRTRGGANELIMVNGKIGKQQDGIFFVKSLEVEGPLPAAIVRTRAKELQTSGEGKINDAGDWLMAHNGQAGTSFVLEKDAEVILRARAYANQCGDEPAKMQLMVDGKAAETVDVTAPGTLLPIPGQHLFEISLLDARPYVYEIREKLAAGKHTFAAGFINEAEDAKNANPNLRKRNLVVSYLEVVNTQAPLPTPAMPAAFARNFAMSLPAGDKKVARARGILTAFARRAWRRPASGKEIERLVGLFEMADKRGETFENSLKLPLKAVLISPHFLFRGEVQADPNNPQAVHPIDEYALATRLSYFLWSTTPDDELLDLAERGELRAHLSEQLKRMVASPKSRALVDNFAAQWLHFRDLTYSSPDKELFPQFDDATRKAMQTETALFCDSLIREDRPVTELLSADYTFLNARLAKFYGIEGVNGEEFRKVSLAGTKRSGGVLTQGSILTLTSNPTRTSPVKRGKWVLENLLNAPPPPPPPNIPALPGDSHPNSGTLREQMERHRADPTCASCHAMMDPIGFGLEHFNAVGQWRDVDDSKEAIDATGVLVTGESFNDPADLAKILITTKRDDFLHAVAEKMLTYALGRGVEYYDRPAVDKIVEQMEAHGDRFSSLIEGIVTSVPFEYRRGENAAAEQ